MGKIRGILQTTKMIIIPHPSPKNTKQLRNDAKTVKNTNKNGILLKRIMIKSPKLIILLGFTKQTNVYAINNAIKLTIAEYVTAFICFCSFIKLFFVSPTSTPKKITHVIEITMPSAKIIRHAVSISTPFHLNIYKKITYPPLFNVNYFNIKRCVKFYAS